MKKLKLGILYTILVICVFSVAKTVFSENIKIIIPETYNINEGNKSVVLLNDKGTNGYGLLFLGDTIDIQTNLTINNSNIICNKQLKGYYTNNFLNFKMFPLDSQTPGLYGVQFSTGGLYYECYNGNEEYTGVYGHIKWRYRSGSTTSRNTHEIRVGLVGEENNLTRSQTSPLQIATQGNYRALSGHFQDYLAKNAIVNADFKERIFIKYPDVFFNNTNTFSGNQNEILFEYGGNDGFGLFFLGTGIENGPYEITDKSGKTLICSGQLNGYYSFSFNDFGMLPLDETTRAQHTVQGINSVTGGLYYNCKDSSNNIYTGVYGYLQRDYNYGNIHELRAGINSNGKFINQSPIEVIYSDNFRNINRTLSGEFHDNLSKESKTSARFFGDLGIIIGEEELKATGTLQDPYFVIPYESYQNAKIYVKSSKENTRANIVLTEFDNNGQNVFDDDLGNLDNTRSLFGFYGYKDNIDFSNNPNLKSGIITTKLTNNENETRTKTIRFEIANPIITRPEITITHTPECSTGIKITANVTVTNYQTFDGYIGYTITDGSDCNDNTTTDRTPYELGQTITFNETGNNGNYICFMASNSAGTGFSRRQITGIDLYGPTFTIQDRSGQECKTGTILIKDIIQIGCATTNTSPYSRNGSSWSTQNKFEIYSGGIGNLIITGYVQDEFGNSTSHTGIFTWENTIPTLTTGTLIYPDKVSGTKTLYENLITKMGANDGACGNSTISTGNINCEYTNGNGIAIWDGYGISVTPPTNAEGTGTCTVRFTDDEGSSVSGKIIYTYDTQPPHITINGPTPGTCSREQTISGTINDNGGEMRYTTGRDVTTICDGNMVSYTPGNPISFTSENYNGTYVCFKAIDSYQNISYATSSVVNNIDRTPPSFDIITGEVFECDTGTIRIENVLQSGCALAHNLQYRWYNNGRLDRSATGIYEIYSENTGTKTVQIIVRDALGNQPNSKTAQITRKNQEITGESEINIGPISETTEIDPIEKFAIRRQGNCEKITVTMKECTAARPELSGNKNDGYTLKIIPDTNTDNDNGQCKIEFTDGDTTLTGIIKFKTKTSEYYVVLDETEGYESGELKLLNDGHLENRVNTGLAHGVLILSSGVKEPLDPNVIDITEIKLDPTGYYPTYQRLKSANLQMDIQIDTEAVDAQFTGRCDTGVFAIEFDTGFISDPAGNPSKNDTVNTNNIYIAGNYFIIENGDSIKTTNSVWSQRGFPIEGYTRFEIEPGTTTFRCIATDSCPGFSCNETGVLTIKKEPGLENSPKQIKLFGDKFLAPFYYKFTLRIDPIEDISQYGSKTIWTGCKIELINGCNNYKTININVELTKTPIKAGMFGEENYREHTLGEAIEGGSGDNGFLFFITHPQSLQSGGVLGNIKYTINFNEDVADEFYHITGSAIVNGYKEDLSIKRPTFNYSNPRGYLFNFPEN